MSADLKLGSEARGRCHDFSGHDFVCEINYFSAFGLMLRAISILPLNGSEENESNIIQCLSGSIARGRGGRKELGVGAWPAVGTSRAGLSKR